MRAHHLRRVVRIDARARAAWPWVPERAAAGTVFVGDGEVLRLRPDGSLEVVLPGGHPRPGPASDPANTRGRQ